MEQNPLINQLFQLSSIEPGSKRKVYNLWNRITDICEEENMNMSATRELLGACLRGDMIDDYELYASQGMNARDIAITLSKMYDCHMSKATYLEQLNKFKRSQYDSVENAVNKLKKILMGIEKFKRPGERS